MKAELSHTRAQIEHMVDMLQQLLQAKLADEGQQEEKSGGSGRETQTMTAAAPEGHRAKKGLMAQELVPQ